MTALPQGAAMLVGKRAHHIITQAELSAPKSKCQDLDQSGQWGGGLSGKV